MRGARFARPYTWEDGRRLVRLFVRRPLTARGLWVQWAQVIVTNITKGETRCQVRDY